MTFAIGSKVIVRDSGVYRTAKVIEYEPAMKPLAKSFTRVHIEGDQHPRLVPHHKVTAWDERLANADCQ